MNSYADAKKWYLSPECIKFIPEWWHVLYGFWDVKSNISALVTKAKCYFAIDYAEFEEEGCIRDLLLHKLRQLRKQISNNMNDEFSLTLSKSTDTHKVDGKNWSRKRKIGEFKEEFMVFRNGNASKIDYNDYCDRHGLKEHKVKLEEVDMSTKVEPDEGFL